MLDALPPGPAAGLPAWCRCRATGRVTPADAAAYRIAVTRLDQDSAEVLMEIVGAAPHGRRPTDAASAARSRTTGATRRPRTVASGSIEMQRILLARAALLAAR